jgi:hypothetical protein
LTSSRCRKTSGARKSFHVAWKAKIATANKTGFDSGSMIRHQIPSSFAPSIRAASTRSAGIVRKNCRIKKINKGVPKKAGATSGQNVLIQSMRWKKMNSGTSRTMKGSIIVLSRIRNSTSRPGNRKRAKP